MTTASNLPEGFTTTFTSYIVDTGTVNLHVVLGGQGPTLLLLSGWPQTWYAWRLVMPALAERFTLVVAEPRGVGLSDKPATGYDTATLAQDMVDLMAALGHKRFSMAGHDIGMWTAYALASDHPHVLDRLVVAEAAIPGLTLSPSIFSSAAGNEKLWHFGFNRLPALNELLVRGNEYAFFSEQFQTKAATRNAIPDHAIDAYVDSIARDPKALRSSFEFYRALDVTMSQNAARQDRRLSLPVLAIGGAHGLAEGVSATMRLAADDVSSVVIPESGHYPAEENPAAVVEAILEFF
ncbi:alpha/beta fold hydrolase [Rhodococcus daqingensis]|uniref:Alpha/beta fold hydrolase n=1 Tax=Rhodococcus daqingensis TaxID=2479363 RepID=A0ABW2RRR1_9NOCA